MSDLKMKVYLVNETQFNKFKYKGTLVVMPEWNFIGT